MIPRICAAIFCSCAIKPVSTSKLYNRAPLPWRTQLKTQAGQGGQLAKRRQAGGDESSASVLFFQNKSPVVAVLDGSETVKKTVKK